MRNAHCLTLNTARKLTNKEIEILTLQKLECGKKTDKRGKGETHMVGHKICRETLQNMQNQKHTLLDLDCGKKSEKRGK